MANQHVQKMIKNATEMSRKAVEASRKAAEMSREAWTPKGRKMINTVLLSIAGCQLIAIFLLSNFSKKVKHVAPPAQKVERAALPAQHAPVAPAIQKVQKPAKPSPKTAIAKSFRRTLPAKVARKPAAAQRGDLRRAARSSAADLHEENLRQALVRQ